MGSPSGLSSEDRRAALGIVGIYAVVAALWICTSDTLLGAFLHDPAAIVSYSELDGLLFIAVTGCLLYYLIARYTRQQRLAEEGLERLKDELEVRVNERTRNLEDSEKRFRALAVASSDVVYRMSPDWREMRELLGKNFLSDTGEPITNWLDKYIHPDDQPHVMEVISEAVWTKGTYELEHRVLQADGTIGWTFSRAVPIFDEAGEIVEWFGTASDVTRRKEAEEAVKKSERKFSTFFHAASELLVITTLKEGRVIDINDIALQALGYTREEIIDKTVHQAHIWENAEDRERAVQMLVEQGSIRNLEIRIKGKSGKTLIALLSAELVPINGEKCILAIARDITERKQAEDEIKRLNAELADLACELRAANKQLEAFNYMVAHDLRNPLNTISTSCQAIERMCGGVLTPECREFVEKAYKSTGRMNRLIGALLDFSRMAHVEPRREGLDLTAMAKEVAAELRQAEPGREVDFRIAEGITAHADVNLLRVVLDNLLGNAWKYTASQEKPVIEFGALTMEEQQVFFVRDNGIGFETADQEKIFVPFQRLPGAEMAKGFGIGLAMVQQIVQRHGGRIWAEAEPMKGACFYFTLS